MYYRLTVPKHDSEPVVYIWNDFGMAMDLFHFFNKEARKENNVLGTGHPILETVEEDGRIVSTIKYN